MRVTKAHIDSIRALLDVVGVEVAPVSGAGAAPSRVFRGQPVDRPLLPRFARKAIAHGTTDVLLTEQRLLDDFSRLALPYVGSIRPQTPYEWLAVAQHYGVPTRLLDWTGNPMFALWFAVRGKPIADFGAFWTLRVEDSRRLPLNAPKDVYALQRTYLFRPSHITSRIVAQDGWFTVHWYIKAKDKFIPLEQQPRFERNLRKHLIPASAFKSLRNGLQRLGISDSVLFPDLASLSKELVTRVFPKR